MTAPVGGSSGAAAPAGTDGSPRAEEAPGAAPEPVQVASAVGRQGGGAGAAGSVPGERAAGVPAGEVAAQVPSRAARSGAEAFADGPDGSPSVPESVRELYGESLSVIEAYVRVLAGRGVEWGLIGPREVPRLWERHVLNSVALAGLVGDGASVVDVGSGAGLPGIPLAILRPDLEVVLLEPLLRRADFLTLTVSELGLDDRVRVVRGRAEEHKAAYDVVTCRAVAPLGRLLGWTNRLFLPRGELLALKGASAPDEVAAATKDLSRWGVRATVLTVRAHPDADPTTVVRVRKS